MLLNILATVYEQPVENELHKRRDVGYLISRICSSLCVRMSRFSTTRLFFPTAICDMLARLRQTKQQPPTGQTEQANSTLCWTPMRCRAASRRPERHRKLSGHEKRRYLSNVTECNIFRTKPIFDKTNFQRTREPRPNYVSHHSSYARRKHGELKIPPILAPNWNSKRFS